MEATIIYQGYIGIMENKMEATIMYRGYIGIMENKMEASIVYRGCIEIMENKMEATIMYRGSIGFIMFSGWFGSLTGICRASQEGQGFKWLVSLMGLQLCELCFRHVFGSLDM